MNTKKSGNLQDVEDMLGSMDMTSSPVVLSVKLQVKGDQKLVGVAFADASIREIGVSEFIDNDVYSNFEVHPDRTSNIVSYNPTGCQRMCHASQRET
jgi:hypothetical protein